MGQGRIWDHSPGWILHNKPWWLCQSGISIHWRSVCRSQIWRECIGKSIGVLTKTSMYSNTPIWLNFSQFVQNGNVYWTPRAFPRLWLAPMLNKKALSDRIGDSALKNHRNESLPRASVATKLWKIGRMNTGEMLLECPTVSPHLNEYLQARNPQLFEKPLR